MKKLTVAQVGCGYWGPNLLRVFSSLPKTKVKMLCDLQPGRLEWARERFAGLQTTADFDQVLCDQEIDAVVVATEPVTHYSLGRKVLDAGKHLFVEKPLACKFKDALDLARRAQSSRLSIGVGHVYLYQPGVRVLKAALTTRRLGQLLYLDLERVNPGPPMPKHSVIWDLAPHEVSLAVDLAGSEPVAVRASGLRWDLSVLEAAFIEIRFMNGVRAQLHASWRGHARVRRIGAYCRNGVAYFDESAAEKLRFVYPGRDNRARAQGKSVTLNYGMPRIETPFLSAIEPLSAECADFVSAARRRQDPQSGATLGVCVVRILEAAERSALGAGGEVRL